MEFGEQIVWIVLIQSRNFADFSLGPCSSWGAALTSGIWVLEMSSKCLTEFILSSAPSNVTTGFSGRSRPQIEQKKMSVCCCCYCSHCLCACLVLQREGWFHTHFQKEVTWCSQWRPMGHVSQKWRAVWQCVWELGRAPCGVTVC